MVGAQPTASSMPAASADPHSPPAKFLAAATATEAGLDAAALAVALATAIGAPLCAAEVLGPGSWPVRSAAWLTDFEAITGGLSIRELTGRSPAETLGAFATAEGCDVIVTGREPHLAFGGFVPGSTTDRLVSGWAGAVAIAPPGYRHGFAQVRQIALSSEAAGGTPSLVRAEPRVIAVGFDGSPESRAALDLAAAIGRRLRATLRVIKVVRPAPALPPEAAAAAPDPTADLRDVVLRLDHELRALPVVEKGATADRLLAKAQEGVDLLVVGSRRRGPLSRVVLGSTSADLARWAPCPVLIAPRPAES